MFLSNFNLANSFSTEDTSFNISREAISEFFSDRAL